MENRTEGEGTAETDLPSGLVSNQERWIFLMGPRIKGKSGKVHEFDFVFCLKNELDYIILGKKFSPEIRNGLAALTYFNAQSDDVSALRKIVFCEKELSPDERLLASALKIEVLKDLSQVNLFLSTSMKKNLDLKEKKLDVSTILSLQRESNGDKSKKKYRDRTRLIQEVLSSASAEDGATLNNIVFKCNLNYNSARKIVDDLIRKELLGIEKNEEEKTVYRVTRDGHRMIEKLMYLDGVNSNE